MLFVMKYVGVLLCKVLWQIPPLVFLWMLAWMTKHPLCQRLSWKKLPQAGEKLGLRFEQARSYSKFGILKGTLKGYEVVVEPDEDAKIRVAFRSEKQLELNQSKPYDRPTAEMPDFKTDSWKFNWIFKTKRASTEVAGIFRLSEDLPEYFIRFYSKWMCLRYIYVSRGYIRCSLSYGHPFYPYIPPSVLPRILDDFVELAVHVDNTLG